MRAFLLDSGVWLRMNVAVRTCVIFNPTAKGDKARRFRERLSEIGRDATLIQTRHAGDASGLAAQAVKDGFDTVVAAGGDGTLNEVLNGLVRASNAATPVRLGHIPLGTVNVFARELGIPLNIDQAWAHIRSGREAHLDLLRAEFEIEGSPQCRFAAILGGAGLDARAVELVDWRLKKMAGPLAYVWAGLKALLEKPAMIEVVTPAGTSAGELVLFGNGRLYGGSYRLFPDADLRDGLVDVCIFPKAGWMTLLRCGPAVLMRGLLPEKAVRRLRVRGVTFRSASRVPFELDGELAGCLPLTLTVLPGALRVVAP